ncbi:transcriptional regulator GAL3 [Sugiyamaella lignohabitans]|uniref:Galactokinase n=1 Tax=Sugiyamaella lignohabitans TaxID=796027 RepID=A0A161HKM4_9ASCO|nr:transcriptional regulator GAL3 [Sugiyamaella lignohabitans]ANB12308.1 transcriptional regulator GAL3 [Sugiyamaella lignohabitans]
MAPIPHKSHLSEIYADATPQFSRYRNLLTKFAEQYGGNRAPDLLLRSPGRVNIIGDHIDYSYFSVLPMAVEADMVMAIALDKDSQSIEVSNVDSVNFPSETVPISKDLLQIDATKSDWVNYFRCGFRVAQEYLKSKDIAVDSCLTGMKVLIDGNVPTGSGLSSSAAFVVCATLAVLQANDYKDISKTLLTQLSIRCEQHVGVNSGGMDQSASIFGLKNHALFVSFVPELKVKEFAFPETNPKLAFVIANSLITANKHETGPVNYNLRVVEVTLAANILAKRLGLTIPKDGNLQQGTLRGVLEKYFEKQDPSAPAYGVDVEDSRKKLSKLSEIVDQYFGDKKDGHTTEEVAEELGLTVDELKRIYMTTYPVRYEKLQLYKRSLHVYEESKRVLDFLSVLESSTIKEKLPELGRLMNESHYSAIHNFQNSCPELDDICNIALANGSSGSRVTGAGFGGSSVHLVAADKAPTLIKALTEQYYNKRFPNLTEAELAEAILISEPGNGTTLIEPGLCLD